LDLRVARQDLLEQRRARARQANDENRIGGTRTLPRARREELRREQRLHAPHLLGIPIRVVTDTLASQAVAFFVVLERLRELPGILERLAEREMKVKAILGRELAARQLRLHRLDIGRLELERLQICQAPIRLAELRRELDALAIRLHAVGLS